jgi:hypothetical protein
MIVTCDSDWYQFASKGWEYLVGKDLIVGSAGLQGLEDPLRAHLAGRGVKNDLQEWLVAEENSVTISCLNGASVVLFLRHVVRCEGYSDEFAGLTAGENGESQYKNMPWWDNSVWLPAEISPGNLEDDPTVFIGSCAALLGELRKLQEVSQLQLGVAPEGFEEMRADIRKIYRSQPTFQLNDEDCVRWIWLALRDGAEMAIRQNTLLWPAPD